MRRGASAARPCFCRTINPRRKKRTALWGAPAGVRAAPTAAFFRAVLAFPGLPFCGPVGILVRICAPFLEPGGVPWTPPKCVTIGVFMVWALKGRRLFSEPLQEGVQGAFFWISGRPRDPISEPRKHSGPPFFKRFSGTRSEAIFKRFLSKKGPESQLPPSPLMLKPPLGGGPRHELQLWLRQLP